MATGSINANGIIKSSNPADKSVPNATVTELASLVLEPGTWLVGGVNQIGSGFNGEYVNYLYLNNNLSAIDTERTYASSGGGNMMWRVLDLSSQTTIRFKMYQGSGSASTAKYISLIAVRLR